MHHLVARTVRHRLLITSHAEGAELYHRLDRALPVEALCVMPDHVHLISAMDVRRPLAALLSGWTRHCNHRRGEEGPLVERLPPAEPLVDRVKQQRSIRYRHLNPTRAKLAEDPLAWPHSTHRDACGLTLRPVGPVRRAESFHRYVSSDPSVAVEGSELPGGVLGAVPLYDVLVAVSAVTRTPMARLKRRATRSLVVVAARELAGAELSEVAVALGCHRASLYRLDPVPREHVRKVARVVGDERFGPIDEGDLRMTPRWARYRR